MSFRNCRSICISCVLFGFSLVGCSDSDTKDQVTDSGDSGSSAGGAKGVPEGGIVIRDSSPGSDGIANAGGDSAQGGEGAAGGSGGQGGEGAAGGSGGQGGEGAAGGSGGQGGEGAAGGSGGEPSCPIGFVLVRAGTFKMGSPTTEKGRDRKSETLHQVTLTHDFCILATEVTQKHYQSVAGVNPAANTTCGENCPVENVTWHQAVAFCNALSVNAGLNKCYDDSAEPGVYEPIGDSPYACNGYRLPTDAEWEYAARDGTSTAFFSGDITVMTDCKDDVNLSKIAWYCGNEPKKVPHEVGGKQADSKGLFDMSGNVWEWCHDWFQKDLGVADVIDPFGPAKGKDRVRRGGGANSRPKDCRSARRLDYDPKAKGPHIGFRVVVPPNKP